MRHSLYSTVEIIFALLIGAVGVTGIVTSMKLRNSQRDALRDTGSPGTEAQQLFQQIWDELDPAATTPTPHLYLNRILAGKEWIHSAANTPAPVPIHPGSRLYWCCRASHNALDRRDYRKDLLPIKTYKDGQYQIAILIYRDYTPEFEQTPIATMTSVIRPEGPPPGQGAGGEGEMGGGDGSSEKK